MLNKLKDNSLNFIFCCLYLLIQVFNILNVKNIYFQIPIELIENNF